MGAAPSNENYGHDSDRGYESPSQVIDSDNDSLTRDPDDYDSNSDRGYESPPVDSDNERPILEHDDEDNDSGSGYGSPPAHSDGGSQSFDSDNNDSNSDRGYESSPVNSDNDDPSNNTDDDDDKSDRHSYSPSIDSDTDSASGYTRRRLGLAHVRPTQSFGDDAKRSVEYLEAVVNLFDDLARELDGYDSQALSDRRIQNISDQILDLQKTGGTAVLAARNIAASYAEFASLHSERLRAVRSDGRLDADYQLIAIGRRIQDLGSELGNHSRVFQEQLEALGRDVDALRVKQKNSLWRKFKHWLVHLLNAVSLFCQAATVIFAFIPALSGQGLSAITGTTGRLARHASEYITSHDREDPANHVIRMLKSRIPSDIIRAKDDLENHALCVQKVLDRVDQVTAGCFINREDAQTAGEEWAEQAKILKSYRKRW